MIVVASENGKIGMTAAVDILGSGGSALDAVEAATRIVEDNTADHSVGTGGYPNILGQVELDASIMEGTTRRAGAVAALHGYSHPISIARAILEGLPHHVMLAGDGAARYAHECDFQQEELLTPDAESGWRRVLSRVAAAGPEHQPLIPFNGPIAGLTREAADPEKLVGTVNFIAVDKDGHIATAVSTSGWAFKYPGRVGDSPIIGAGNYCDDRFGACCCTGIGEWSIRAVMAHNVVNGMEFGLALDDACNRAMDDLKSVPLPEYVERTMSLVAVDRNGNHTGLTTKPGVKYVWQTPDMDSFQIEKRIIVRV